MDLPLAEGDVGDNDSEGDGIPNGRAVGVTDVDAVMGGDHDPVELAVGRRVVHRRAADQDIDALVQADDQPLVARLAGQHHAVEQSGLPIALVNPLARTLDRKSCTERARVFVARFPAVG